MMLKGSEHVSDWSTGEAEQLEHSRWMSLTSRDQAHAASTGRYISDSGVASCGRCMIMSYKVHGRPLLQFEVLFAPFAKPIRDPSRSMLSRVSQGNYRGGNGGLLRAVVRATEVYAAVWDTRHRTVPLSFDLFLQSSKCNMHLQSCLDIC